MNAIAIKTFFTNVKTLIYKYKNTFIEILIAAYFVVCAIERSVFPYTMPDVCGLLIGWLIPFFLLFGLKIVLDAIERKAIPVSFLCLLGLAVAITLITTKMDVCFLVFIVGSARGCDVKKIVRNCLIGVGAFYFIVFILSVVGVVPDWSHVRNGIVRHSYGFDHPTNFACIYMSLALMLLYVRGLKITYYELAVVLALGGLIFYLSDGRLAFILVVLAVVIFLVLKLVRIDAQKIKDRLPTKIFKWTVIALPLILMALSVILSLIYKYDLGFVNFINEALSGRIELGAQAFENYGVSVLGQNITWFGWGGHGYVPEPENFVYNFVDNGFLRALFDYGIIAIVLILAGYTMVARKTAKNDDLVGLVIFALVLVWAFVEPVLFRNSTNVFIVMLCPYLFFYDLDLSKFFTKSKSKAKVVSVEESTVKEKEDGLDE